MKKSIKSVETHINIFHTYVDSALKKAIYMRSQPLTDIQYRLMRGVAMELLNVVDGLNRYIKTIEPMPSKSKSLGQDFWQ